MEGIRESARSQDGGYTENRTSSDILLVFYNGNRWKWRLRSGPGCSSLGAGGLSVLGPFRINRDGKTLRINPTSWNQEANILFLETPAGVGFSYSNITRESEGGDDGRTAIDNFRFLVNWFERFPEYKGHDFYIAGESYAGAYVPTLAYLISNYNNKANETINLKGIMLGNAYMGDTEHNQGEYDNLWHNGIISKRVHQALTDCLTTDLGSICNDASYDLNGAWQALNFYDIYDPVQCNQWQFMKPPIDSYSGSDILYNCTREPIAVYLNRPEVQDALHVPRPTKPWSWCNMPLHNGYVWTNSTIAYLDFLLKHGTPVMIYNGDSDGAVPIAEAKILIKQLQYPMKFQNRPWFSSPIEVGGFTTVYQRNESERLTFATVRGGSHMAPLDEGSRSIHLVRSFLIGEQLPYSNLAPKALYECC